MLYKPEICSPACRDLWKRGKDVAEESNQGENEKPAEQPVAKKQPMQSEVREQKLSPKPSFWPIALAVAMVVTGIGVISHPAVFICGIVLIIAAIIGWALEKH